MEAGYRGLKAAGKGAHTSPMSHAHATEHVGSTSRRSRQYKKARVLQDQHRHRDQSLVWLGSNTVSSHSEVLCHVVQELEIAVRDSHMTGRAAVGLVRIPLCQLPLGGQQKLWLPVQASAAGLKVCCILLHDRSQVFPQTYLHRSATGYFNGSRRQATPANHRPAAT